MKLIWKIFVGFGSLVSAVAILYGAFTILDDIRDETRATTELVEHISVEQTFLSEDIDNLNDSIKKQNKKIDGMGEDMAQLGWIVQNQNIFTPEQLDLLLDEFLKKNYGWIGSMQTPFVYSTCENTTEQENMTQ